MLLSSVSKIYLTVFPKTVRHAEKDAEVRVAVIGTG